MDDSLKDRTVASLFWKLMERAGNQMVLLAVQVVMARMLSPDDFGLLAIILVFINLANVFVQSGLGVALVQTPEATDKDSSTVFWVSFAVSVILFAALFLGAPFIAAAYRNELLTAPLRALAPIVFFNALNSVQIARVQRSLQYRIVFRATLWSVCVSGIVGIIAALVGAGIWALVAQQLLYQIVNCASLYCQEQWIPQLVFNARRAKELFGFGWKVLASNLINQGFSSLYSLVIGAQFSTAQLGLVSQGEKYPAALGRMLDGAVQPVMMSAVSRVQSDINRVKRLTRRSLTSSTFVVVPCMTLFAVAAQPIVSLLLGEKWTACVPFLQMNCFVYALLPIHSSNLSALSGIGRSDINLFLEVVKKGVGILALTFGAFVVRDIFVLVATSMVTGVISTVINSFPNKRLIGYSYGEQIRDIAPACVLSAIAGGLAYFTGGFVATPILAIFAEAFVMATAYLGLSWLLKLEALTYLISTGRDMLRSKMNRKDRCM